VYSRFCVTATHTSIPVASMSIEKATPLARMTSRPMRNAAMVPATMPVITAGVVPISNRLAAMPMTYPVPP
jgi:hypothetical protein